MPYPQHCLQVACRRLQTRSNPPRSSGELLDVLAGGTVSGAVSLAHGHETVQALGTDTGAIVSGISARQDVEGTASSCLQAGTPKKRRPEAKVRVIFLLLQCIHQCIPPAFPDWSSQSCFPFVQCFFSGIKRSPLFRLLLG